MTLEEKEEANPSMSQSAQAGRQIMHIIEHYSKVRKIIIDRQQSGSIDKEIAWEAVHLAGMHATNDARPLARVLKTLEFRK